MDGEEIGLEWSPRKSTSALEAPASDCDMASQEDEYFRTGSS